METLFAWTWQASALALAVAAALRLAPRLSAASRHAIWWVTLACVLIMPAVHLAGRAVSEGMGAVTASAAGASALTVGWSLPAPPDWAVAIALGAWLGTVLLACVRIVRSVRHVRCLARSSEPLDAERESRLSAWGRERGAGRAMQLRVSGEVAVPCALGLGRAIVLLPRDLVARIDDDDLDRLVMHERAHLLRRDDWLRLLEASISALFGLHPAVAWIARRIDLERETACDDYVVSVTGDAHRYASCLADAAAATLRNAGTGGLPRLAPGALRSRGVLERRVVRIIDRRTGRRATSRGVLAACGCGVAGVAVVFASASPMVRFEAAPAEVAVRESSATPSRLEVLGDVLPERLSRDSVTPFTPGTRNSVRFEPPPAAAVPVGAARQAAPSAPSVDGAASVGPGQAAVEQDPRPDVQSTLELSASLPVDAGIRPLAVGTSTPADTHAPAEGDRGAWADVAHAGSGVGTGAKKAGLAIGGWFGRTGKAIGSSF